MSILVVNTLILFYLLCVQITIVDLREFRASIAVVHCGFLEINLTQLTAPHNEQLQIFSLGMMLLYTRPTHTDTQ